MSNEIKKLQELAGISSQGKAKKEKQLLDEHVIGGMQEVRHVSEDHDEDGYDYDSCPSDESDDIEMGDDLDELKSILGELGINKDPEVSEDYDDDEIDRNIDVDVDIERPQDQLDDEEDLDDPFYGKSLNFESAPPGMEEWIKNHKDEFKNRYGDDWEKVLYSTAWKMHDKENVTERGEDTPFRKMDDENDFPEKNENDEEQEERHISMLDLEMMGESSDSVLSDLGFDDSEVSNMTGRRLKENKSLGRCAEIYNKSVELYHSGKSIDEITDMMKEAYNLDESFCSTLKEVLQDRFGISEDVKSPEQTADELVKMMFGDESSSEDHEDEEIEEDCEVTQVDVDGYFPNGAHYNVSDDAGPSSAKQGDNALQKDMSVSDEEKESVKESLVRSYRKHLKDIQSK